MRSETIQNLDYMFQNKTFIDTELTIDFPKYCMQGRNEVPIYIHLQYSDSDNYYGNYNQIDSTEFILRK